MSSTYNTTSVGTGDTWTYVETGTTGERYYQTMNVSDSLSPVKPKCKGRVIRPRNRLSTCSQGTRRPENFMRIGTCRNLDISPNHRRINIPPARYQPRSRSPMGLLRNAFERWQRRHRRA